ncbi:aldehyde dehydrogenase [Trametes elegans]|nr:aldehyde dehydrogenase [Trametes elegans]
MSLKYTALDEIPRINETARRAWLSGKAKPLAFRKEQIAQVAYLVKDNEQRFKDAMKADLGRPYLETEFFDFGIVYAEARTAYDSIETWTREHAPDFSPNWFFMSPRLKPEPKGVVLMIAPFNYPLFLLLVPLISAIAGGNAAVLKPPEHTPAFSALLADLVPQYLDSELYHVINGAVPETAKILELKWDHIMYTGNTRVGRIIAGAAAKHLTPLTLELGGKNPVVVDSRTDLELAAKRILWGRVSNAGQICLAPDYVLVPEETQEALVAAFRKANQQFFPDGAKTSDSFGRIVTEAHTERIGKLINQTRGTIAFGGEIDIPERYVAPTVVSNVHPDDPLMVEEIFGPVLAVVPVKDVDEAIAYINSRDYPLGVYIFSNDKKFQDKVTENTQSGSVMINETLIAVGAPGLPVGGKGSGGYGYYTGKYGFDQFVHMRVSLKNPSWSDTIAFWARYPPYTPAATKKLRSFEAKLPPRPGKGDFVSGIVWIVAFATVVAGVSSVVAKLRVTNHA